MTELPSGWIEAQVADVADVISGQAPPGKSYNESAIGLPLFQGKTDFTDLYIGEPRLWTTEATKLAEHNDVLLSVRAPVGPTNLARERCAIGRGLAAVRGRPGVIQRYLLYALRVTASRLESQATGTTFAAITSGVIRSHSIRLAPTAEQKRIVAAIEEQFSRLDAAVAALARVRQNVKHMKSALLRDSWDAAMAAAGGVSRVVDLLESPLANGRSVPDGPSDGFPVLRLTCVRDGMIDDTETKAGAWTAQQAKQYLVREGDFLVVRGNGSRHLVGRGGIVTRDAAVAYPDTLIRIRPHPNRITARFLGLLWNSSSVRVQLENSARTTAGIYKINQQSLGRIELPVPARDIQAKIVSDADRDLSRSHLLEAEIANAIGRTSRLRSAILVAAFAGKLVPRNPSDEPASALLERIRAERARSNGHTAAVDRKPQTRRRKVPA